MVYVTPITVRLMRFFWLLPIILLSACGQKVGVVIGEPDTGTDTTTVFNDADTESDTQSRTQTDSATVFDSASLPDSDSIPDSSTFVDSAIATDSSTTADTATSSADLSALPYIIGADISVADEQEDLGVVFSDSDGEADIFQILTKHGFNFIRLRLFVNPGQPDGYQFAYATRAEPYCDLSHTLEMARRVKAAGMQLFLSIRYSDTWTNPEEQTPPAAWQGFTFEELEAAVYTYTKDILSAFRGDGTLPAMVQFGNEITNGMLFPQGAVSDDHNWDQLARLLNAALNASKEVDPTIVTVLHLDLIDQLDWTTSWMNEALARDVHFDALALSAYTRWHGEPSVWNENLQEMSARFPNHYLLIAQYADEHIPVHQYMRDTPRGMGAYLGQRMALRIV